MKKLKLLKKGLTLFLVLFLCVNNFAAIVSDNDGSAFITKAEFDSLKNDFQSQIDKYNTSIDAKIDGAIAAYLAGIKVEKEQIKSLFVRTWSDYTVTNGAFAQTYEYPDFSNSINVFHYRFNANSYYDNPVGNLVMGANVASDGNRADQDVIDLYSSSGNNQSGKQLWAYAAFDWKNTKTSNRRNLVQGVVIGESPDTTNMTWAGRANNVTEFWANSRSVYFNSDPAYMNDTTAAKQKFVICTPLRINADGYISSFTDACLTSEDGEFLWRPSIEWDYQEGSNVGTDNYTLRNWGYGNRAISASSIPTITYDADATGEKISYLHVGNYKGSDSWEVTAKDVTNYALYSTNNSKRSKDWLEKVVSEKEIGGKWSGHELGRNANRSRRGLSYVQAWRTDQPVEFSDRNAGQTTYNNAQIPVIGLLGNFTANNIYQFNSGDVVDDEGNDIEPIKMQQGLPIMQVKESEKIEWTPTFSKISVTGAASVNECKVILAYEPFSDLTTVSSVDKYVKMDGVERGSFIETTGGKVTIKFEADRSGYVYAKWVPKTTDTIISNNNWEVCLDIKNCNTYKSIKE
ncbi:MAG: hypothetical protein IKP66_03045 [Lachnospiraceae bacterium]|nr:hypothetical protein [Lachnospiraceae bacterium]